MRTSKKLLSFFLAIVMVITSCSVGFTAFAADGNKTDANLTYWNNKTEAEEAFESIEELLGLLIQLDAVKNLLANAGVTVDPNDGLPELVEKLSPTLLNALVDDVSKEDFLTEKYGEKYTKDDASRQMYNDAFSPLDAENPKDGDWSFYKLYKFCEAGQDSSNGALKNYCKDTLKKLDKLIKDCEKNLDTRADSDEAIRKLYNTAVDNKTTLVQIENNGSPIENKTLGQVTFGGLSEDEEEDLLKDLLGKGNDYYYYYYKNIFMKIGMEDELDTAAKLFFYHATEKGQILLNTYIYLYLMEKSGNTLKADKLTNDASLKDTELKTSTLVSTIKSTSVADTSHVYRVTDFTNDYLGRASDGKVFVANRVNDTAKWNCYYGYWAYGIFDKYFAHEADYNTGLDTAVTGYGTLLREINREASLVSSPSDNDDTLGDQMIEALGDKGGDYQINEHGFKVAEYFRTEICNKKEHVDVDKYNYADYDNMPESAKVAAANTALNTKVLGIINSIKGIIDIQKLLDNNFDGNINLMDVITDIWQRLYDAPAETVFNLLPVVMVLLENVLPVIFHDDIDDCNLIANLFNIEPTSDDPHKPQHILDDMLLTPDGLVVGIGQLISGEYNPKLDLYRYTQAAGNTEIGIGAMHIDLNILIPSFLHWITGDKAGAYEIAGRYEDVTYHKAVYNEDGTHKTKIIINDQGEEEEVIVYEDEESVAHYNHNVPRFTNIYIADLFISALNLDNARDNSMVLINLLTALLSSKGIDLSKINTDIGYDIFGELLTFMCESVDEYLVDAQWVKGVGSQDKNLARWDKEKYREANDGLNDFKVALPKLIDHMGTHFIDKYAVKGADGNKADWRFNYSGKIKTRTVDGKTETYNVHVDNFENLNDMTRENAIAVLNSIVDLLIGNWINALTDFLNDVLSDDSNKITSNVPLVYGLFAALGDFGEKSIITDALNGLFQLKRCDAATFTLTKRATTNFVGFDNKCGFFLICNIYTKREDGPHGLIPFIKGLTNKNATEKADYDITRAIQGRAPLLAASRLANKNVSAAGTDYDKLLTPENLKAAKKLVNVLDEVLSSLLSNTSLNGFDLDATDNVLSGVVTTFAAYFGGKNTNDLLKLVNNYLFYVSGETLKTPSKRGKIGEQPDSNGDVNDKKVYTSANLSNLVIQTYSFVENLIDYLFYNKTSGKLNTKDTNMLVADALYGIISPDAVAIRLSDKYGDTADILKKKDNLNWNSFKVQATELNYTKQTYNTHDFLKYGFSKGDKKAFYEALGESFNGIAGVVGALLATSITEKGTDKNLYSEVLYPVLNTLAGAVGASTSNVMSVADFNKAFKDGKFGDTLVKGIILPIGAILNEIFDAPASFILNLVKGLGGLLRDQQIAQIVGGLVGTLNLHINGLADILGVNISNLSPTLAKQLPEKIGALKIGSLQLSTLLNPSLPSKDIGTALLNKLLGSKLKMTLPTINFEKLYAAKSPAEVLLLVYGYVVDSLLGMDLITNLIKSLDKDVAKILKGLSAAQLLTMIVKIIDVFKSPTEVYWSFSEYAKKIKNTFKYPDCVTPSEAREDVDKLDNIVANIFPLLNSLGVTDIKDLNQVVRDNLYTNEILTKIATGLYGAITGNDTVTAVFQSLEIDVTPKGMAKYLTDKKYGKKYTAAAKKLRKTKNWKKVKTLNWGFKDKTNGAKNGFINGLAAVLRPLNDVLAVLLCEGKLELIDRLDIVNLLNALNIKGSTEILKDKGENAATLNYQIKKGKFILTVQSYNITGTNHRTTKSELVIDINSFASDLEKLFKGVDYTLGTNGYENAIIPILEAFMCPNIKTYKQYKKDYKKAKDNLLIDILKPIAGFIDDVTYAPFDTLTGVLPNLAYFIDSCGVSQAVANLLAPITSEKGVLGVMKKNGLDLDKLITSITGKSLGKILADAIGVTTKINLQLSNLKAFNIQDIVVPLLQKLLKEKLGMKLPTFTWKQIASHGKIKVVKSKAKNDKGKYTTRRVIARKGEVLVAVLRYVAKTLIINAQALKKLICGIDAIKDNDTLKGIIGSIFDNIGMATTDEILGAVFYLLNGKPTDKFFDYRNFEYKSSNFKWGELDEDFCRKLAPMLDGLIGGLLEGGLTGLVEEKLYTDELVAKAAKGIYGAVEGVNINDTIGSLSNLLKQTDIDFTTSGVASLLTNRRYGKIYPSAANAIRSAGTWDKVNVKNLKFGVKDRDSFLHALTAVLRPVFGVLDVLLNDKALNLFNLIDIPGSDGYTSTIVPLLEAFGVYNIKTQYQYREDCFYEYDNLLLDIINPLWDKVEDVLAAPLETVADILPNLALFFANDGLTQILDNLLTPITALLDALKPIANINDILLAANLDVKKLLKDKLGLTIKKFDVYDLRGTLNGIIGAKKVVPLINSILKVIEIKGTKLNLELPDIDWLALAACGKMVFDEPSQVACYGARMYVKSDQDITLITVLRFLVSTINYKGNYDAIVDLVKGLLGDASDSVADVVGQVLGMLQGDTDKVILDLIDLLQTLAG